MAKLITTSVSVTVSGDGMPATPAAPIVAPSFPFANNAGTAGGEFPQALSSGNNTISVPSGHRGVWIIPPAGSVITKILKGIAGDTGVTIDPVLGAILFFPTGTTSLIINASAPETVQLLWL